MLTGGSRYSRILRFFAVTLLGLLTDFFIFFILQTQNVPAGVSNFISTCSALAVTYFLSSRIVFEAKIGVRTAIKYLAWYAFSNFMFSNLLQVLTDNISWAPILLKGMLLPFSFAINYWASSRILTRRDPEDD